MKAFFSELLDGLKFGAPLEQSAIAAHGHALPPLHLACLRGDWRAARAAIQAGADVNEKITMQNKNGSSMINSVTPVYLAAQVNKLKLVKFLVLHGADLNVPAVFQSTHEHCTPLEMALLNVNPSMAIFIQAEAERQAQGPQQHKPPRDTAQDVTWSTNPGFFSADHDHDHDHDHDTRAPALDMEAIALEVGDHGNPEARQ